MNVVGAFARPDPVINRRRENHWRLEVVLTGVEHPDEIEEALSRIVGVLKD